MNVNKDVQFPPNKWVNPFKKGRNQTDGRDLGRVKVVLTNGPGTRVNSHSMMVLCVESTTDLLETKRTPTYIIKYNVKHYGGLDGNVLNSHCFVNSILN